MKSDKTCPDIRALVNVYCHWGSHWTPPGRMRVKRTNYGRFSVKCRGAIIWKSLPSSLKEIESLQLFKRKLKHFVQ